MYSVLILTHIGHLEPPLKVSRSPLVENLGSNDIFLSGCVKLLCIHFSSSIFKRNAAHDKCALFCCQDSLKTHNRHQGDGQKDSEQELCPSRAITLPLRNPSSTDSCCQLASRGSEWSCQCTVVRTFWNWALGRRACRAPRLSRADCYCQVQRAWKQQFYSTGIPITFTGAQLPRHVHSCHAGCLSSHCFCPSDFFFPLPNFLGSLQNLRWTGREIWLAGHGLN